MHLDEELNMYNKSHENNIEWKDILDRNQI
jgi:hypothetical protein